MDHRRLVLMRHAKTEPVPLHGHTDFDRALLPRGKADARAAASWLLQQDLVPQLVLVSTAVRAQETWTTTGGKLGDLGVDVDEIEVRSDLRIYNATPQRLHDVLAEVADNIQTVLLVGHSPGVPDLVPHIVDPDSSDSSAVDAFNQGFATSTLAVLDIDRPWQGIVAGAGVLTQMHTARW